MEKFGRAHSQVNWRKESNRKADDGDISVTAFF